MEKIRLRYLTNTFKQWYLFYQKDVFHSKPIDISVLHKVYHAFYKPLEYTIAEKDASQCYIKVVGDIIASFHASSHKAFTRSNDQISAEVFLA